MGGSGKGMVFDVNCIFRRLKRGRLLTWVGCSGPRNEKEVKDKRTCSIWGTVCLVGPVRSKS